MRTANILLLLAAASATGAAAQQRVDRTIPTSRTGEVSVENTAGQVRVIGWDRAEVRVTGTLGAGAERLDVDGDGTRASVRVVVPRGTRRLEGSDLEVRVPAGKHVVVQTTSADIAVEGVTGPVDGHTTSGNVRVGGSPASVAVGSTSGDVRVAASTGRVRANSTSGDVDVSGSAGESVYAESTSGDVTARASTPDLTARSVSGNLTLSGASRRAMVSTVSGSVDIRTDRLQSGSFESVSGDLRFEGDLQRDAVLNAQSHSGDVVLRFPAGVDAAFRISTFSGNVENAFGGAVNVGRSGPGQELRFTTGSGGPLVTVKTFSGSVRLERR